jgi:putative transposase
LIMTERFDFDKALKAVQSGQAISGKDGVLAPLLKQLTEAALEAELESHIADDVVPNRKNGKSRKTLKKSEGRFGLNTPRDRAGTFEPQIIKKLVLPRFLLIRVILEARKGVMGR